MQDNGMYGGGMLNPAAEAYAYKRLMQMVRMGLLGGMPSNTGAGGGYAALWRGLSGSLNPLAQQAGYGNAGIWLRRGPQGPPRGRHVMDEDPYAYAPTPHNSGASSRILPKARSRGVVNAVRRPSQGGHLY